MAYLRQTVLALTFLMACGDIRAPAGPAERSLETPSAVGPAPLRRLSNAQYVYVLHDLFPDLHPELPELPADGVVAGFENGVDGQTASDVRIARYEEIAHLYAKAAVSDPATLETLVGCSHADEEEGEEEACATSFIERQGARLFRRPLTAEEVERFVLRFERWTRSVDFEAAVELTLAALLQAPQFLYRVESPEQREPGVELRDPYAMASQLSFLLWESVPDAALYQAAARDELATVEQVRAQAERMLRNPRAKRMFWSFHRQWLALDRVLGEEHGVRTSEVDPAWSASRQQAAARETQLFVEQVSMEEGTLDALLTSRRAFLDAEMADLYGIELPASFEPWSEISLASSERAGVLTRAAFLAATSHRGATSPPIRANAVNLRLLCRLPVEPPADANITPPEPADDSGPKTNRMLYEERTAGPTCQGCHIGLNGMGFGFESYTAAGAYSESDHGLPIDASGRLFGTDVDGEFVGAVALSERLSASEQVHRCAVQNWLRYALGRAPAAEEQSLVDALSADFTESEGDLHALLAAIATADTFRMQRTEER